MEVGIHVWFVHEAFANIDGFEEDWHCGPQPASQAALMMTTQLISSVLLYLITFILIEQPHCLEKMHVKPEQRIDRVYNGYVSVSNMADMNVWPTVWCAFNIYVHILANFFFFFCKPFVLFCQFNKMLFNKNPFHFFYIFPLYFFFFFLLHYFG